MKAYRVEKQVVANGELKLNDLPFQAGEEVAVIILSREKSHASIQPSDLHGKVIEYVEPTEPIAEGDWEVLQ